MSATQPTIYQKYGYANRKDYLVKLAERHNVKPELVFQAAALLGPSEDFDGLISTLEDIQFQIGSF